MLIGVIEWASDSLMTPSVYVGDLEDIMHWAASEMRGYTFDDGGPIDEVRDRYSPLMTHRALAEWHEEMWEASTDAWLGIYAFSPGFGEAPFLYSGSNLP